MNERIERFINAKKYAVVGVSTKKFGGDIYRTLKQRGLTVFPVHPTATTFDDDPCYPDLSSLPETVDAAVITISPEKTMPVVEDAKKAGVPRLWFQQGAKSPDAVAKAESYGIETVTGKCILVYAPPVNGIHAFHRAIWKLIGAY